METAKEEKTRILVDPGLLEVERAHALGEVDTLMRTIDPFASRAVVAWVTLATAARGSQAAGRLEQAAEQHEANASRLKHETNKWGALTVLGSFLVAAGFLASGPLAVAASITGCLTAFCTGIPGLRAVYRTESEEAEKKAAEHEAQSTRDHTRETLDLLGYFADRTVTRLQGSSGDFSI